MFLSDGKKARLSNSLLQTPSGSLRIAAGSESKELGSMEIRKRKESVEYQEGKYMAMMRILPNGNLIR